MRRENSRISPQWGDDRSRFPRPAVHPLTLLACRLDRTRGGEATREYRRCHRRVPAFAASGGCATDRNGIGVAASLSPPTEWSAGARSSKFEVRIWNEGPEPILNSSFELRTSNFSRAS